MSKTDGASGITARDPSRPAEGSGDGDPRSGGGPDFQRLGDLLGDVCDSAAGRPPTGASSDERNTGVSDEGTEGIGAGARGRACHPGAVTRQVASIWPEAVGAEVASNARPVQFKNGRLAVSVSSPVWAQTLQFMAEAIASRLNEYLGERAVTQVVFRHAGWEENPPRRSAEQAARLDPKAGEDQSDPGLSALQREALDGLAHLGLSPELRARIARAMEAAFVREGRETVR